MKLLGGKERTKVLGWFRGNPLEDGGKWMGGWFGSISPLVARCEHSSSCPVAYPVACVLG